MNARFFNQRFDPSLQRTQMKILFVTSEIHPLIKTGGLADVSGALPAALQALGQDVRVLIPGYTQVLDKLENKRTVATFTVFPGQPRNEDC
jgi:starch synthase